MIIIYQALTPTVVFEPREGDCQLRSPQSLYDTLQRHDTFSNIAILILKIIQRLNNLFDIINISYLLISVIEILYKFYINNCYFYGNLLFLRMKFSWIFNEKFYRVALGFFTPEEANFKFLFSGRKNTKLIFQGVGGNFPLDYLILFFKFLNTEPQILFKSNKKKNNFLGSKINFFRKNFSLIFSLEKHKYYNSMYYISRKSLLKCSMFS